MENSTTSTTCTEGPWIVINHNEICADNEHESFVAEVFDETDQWKANARLIASAPELLNLARSFHCACVERMGTLRDERAEPFADIDGIDDQLGHWRVLLKRCKEGIANAVGKEVQ